MSNGNLSIYIHYPFCLSKCPYCDFNSYVIEKNIGEKLLTDCYIKEIEYYYKILKDRKIETIFFGGGTPSLMSLNMLEKILNSIDKFWGIENTVEISLEANPSSVENNKFKQYKQLGVNRISIGVQALDNKWLNFLGRIHTKEEALKSIELAQKYFENHYSIDLIYARPQQQLKNWLLELKKAIKLSPFHISLYQLTIVEGTKFFTDGVEELDSYKASIMYDRTNEILEQNDILKYEVSNYAKTGYECKHNLIYWNSGEWIGIGAGASGRFCKDYTNGNNDYYTKRTATENHKAVNDWIQSILSNGNGIKNINVLTEKEFIEEVLLMGLRTIKGVELNNISKYLKINSITDLISNKKTLQFLKDNNFIEYNDNHIKVRADRFNILDSIIEKLI